MLSFWNQYKHTFWICNEIRKKYKHEKWQDTILVCLAVLVDIGMSSH